MSETKRLWTMNLENGDTRRNALLVLAKGPQLFTVATNLNHNIPLVFENEYNAALYIYDRFPETEWKETIACLTTAANVCSPEQTQIVAVMRPLVLDCPGCGKPFSETRQAPRYGTVICPHCGALVQINRPEHRL